MPCGDRCHWAMASFCFAAPTRLKSGAVRSMRQTIHSIMSQLFIAAFPARAPFAELRMDGAKEFSWWGMTTRFRLLQLEVMFLRLFLFQTWIRLLRLNLTRPRSL